MPKEFLNDPLAAHDADTHEWNVDELADQILEDTRGKFTRAEIEEAVSEAAGRFRHARVSQFVPIFIRRQAVEMLRKRDVQEKAAQFPKT